MEWNLIKAPRREQEVKKNDTQYATCIPLTIVCTYFTFMHNGMFIEQISCFEYKPRVKK